MMPKRRVKERRRWQRDLAQQIHHHRGRPKPPEVSAGHPRPPGKLLWAPITDPDGTVRRVPIGAPNGPEIEVEWKEESK
jgi:hypothetical protein